MVPFPFSDLSASKYRPALVLADVGRDDWTLCVVTSNAYGDRPGRGWPVEGGRPVEEGQF